MIVAFGTVLTMMVLSQEFIVAIAVVATGMFIIVELGRRFRRR